MSEAEREAREIFDDWMISDLAVKEVHKPDHVNNWRWVNVAGRYYEFQTEDIVKRFTRALQRAEQRGRDSILNPSIIGVEQMRSRYNLASGATTIAFKRGLLRGAEIAENVYPKGKAHTYASENADFYLGQEEGCRVSAEAIRKEAEGKS